MFRLVTYNIRAALGLDGVRSISRVARVLEALNADVICLQEVDQCVPRSLSANQPEFLAVKLGMYFVFQGNLALGGGSYGNCVLTRQPPIYCKSHRLPGSGEPRGLLEVGTMVEGTEVVVMCTHLSTEKQERLMQAQKVAEISRGISGPKILCGDMNDIPGSATLAKVLEDPVLRDCALQMEQAQTPTLQTPTRRRIDYVFADLSFAVKSYQVVASEASDHCPVVVDLELI